MEQQLQDFGFCPDLEKIEEMLIAQTDRTKYEHQKQEFRTAEYYEQSQKNQDLKSRSLKPKVTDRGQISFQISILDSHYEAVQNLISQLYGHQFLSRIRISQEIGGIFFISKNSSENTNQLNKLIISNDYVPNEDKQQLLLDLQRESNLTKFLVFLSFNFCEDLGKILLALGLDIWETYVALKPQIMLTDLSQFVGRLQRKVLNDSQQHLQRLSKELKHLHQPEKCLNKFIEKFIETIYLVIEEFFDNPYSTDGENPLKRERPFTEIDFSNEDEEECSWEYLFSKTSKMRKM